MDRAKRVRRLKKIIIAVLIAGVVIPTVLCIAMLFRLNRLERRLDELLTKRQSVTVAQEQAVAAAAAAEPADGAGVGQTALLQRMSDGTEQTDGQQTGGTETAQPGGPTGLRPDGGPEEVSGQDAVSQEPRKVYLTFDDGPSVYTDEILDILKEYGIKATFFVVGREDEHSLAMYRRIVAEGHTLGMHSYSHKYAEIYASGEAFAQDMERLSELLYTTTGVRPSICRFPGGSSNRVSSVDMEELFDWLREQGIAYYDWNISGRDAAAGRLSTGEIVKNCTSNLESYHSAMILLHDAADKHTTVEALPIIIEYGLNMENTVFLPVTDDTAPIQHK